jgi:hypothetical protein
VLNGSVGGDVLGQTGSYTKQGAVAGRETVTVQERRPEAPTTRSSSVVGELRRYLGILLFGGLLWLAPGAMRAAGTMVRERPLPTRKQQSS